MSPAAVLERAKTYPYPRPDSSFIYINGHTYLLHNCATHDGVAPSELQVKAPNGSVIRLVDALQQHGLPLRPDWAQQFVEPIMAIGSNASSQQLAHKYSIQDFPAGVVIPVTQCVLEDFDVVYAPTLAGYGSCPASLQYSQGTKVQVFITYLTKQLAERMHATEGGYDLLRLDNIRLHEGCSLQQLHSEEAPAAARLLTSAICYNHSLGCLTLQHSHLPVMAGRGSTGSSKHGSSAVAIADVPALQRSLPALTQTQLLRALHRLMQPAHAAVGPAAEASDASDAAQLKTVVADPSILGGRQVVAEPVAASTAVTAAAVTAALTKVAAEDGEELDRWILAHVQDWQLRSRRQSVLRKMRQAFAYSMAVRLGGF